LGEITTVFFDLGDTLWHLPKMPHVDQVRGQTMRQVGGLIQSWGFELTEGRRMLGRDIRLMVEEETRRSFHGDCVDPGYPGICRRVAKMHEMELTVEQADELWEAWNLGGLFLGRELFPDVPGTLAELARRGYRLASITNRGYGGPKFWEEVREFGLDKAFEEIVVSCDVGYLKPHPRIYQYALEKMRLEADECVMVGDSMRADVEGSKTVGMTAVWRRPPLDEPVEEATDEPEVTGPVAPDYTIREIGELLELPILRGR
jgi:HAD superfamily hydrolase (TIGR01662 family)